MAPKPTSSTGGGATGSAKGVRVATAYVEIAADTSGIPDQIKDALNQAGSKNARQAGEQIGKEVATGINDGLKKAPSSSTGSVLDDVVKGKPIGPGPRAQGKKVGQEIGKGIDEGIKSGGGANIDESITKSAKPRETGQKIGKEINEGIGEIIRDAGKDFGKELADNIRKGDLQEAFSRVGDVVANVTGAIDNIGKITGINLDSIGNLGKTVAEELDEAGGGLQGVVDKIKQATDKADDVDKLAGRFKALGEHVDGIPGKIGKVGEAIELLNEVKAQTEDADAWADTHIPFVHWMNQYTPDKLGKMARDRVNAFLSGIASVFNPAQGPPLPADFGGRGPNPTSPGSLLLPPAGGGATNPSPVLPGTNLPVPVSPGAAAPGGNALGPNFFIPSAAAGANSGAPAAVRPLTFIPGQWADVDAIAAQFGLTAGSRYRSPTGPTIAGVPAAQSYHASGRATDYSGTPQQRLAFANYMAANYGGQLKELIYDAPGFTSTIKDGQIKGPFGAFYTLAQAGDHSDHVHIAFQDGGPVDKDEIAKVHAGEHVLTAEEVQALGGQDSVSQWRGSLRGIPGPPNDPGVDYKLIERPALWNADFRKWFMWDYGAGRSLGKGDISERQRIAFRDYMSDVVEKRLHGVGGMFNPNAPLDTSMTSITGKPLPWMFSGSFQQGGPVDEDQLAKLHGGEHVLTADEVTALGGQDSVAAMRDNLSSGSGRTAGFVPVGAGSKSVAGTSFVAGLLNLGNEAVAGLIDTGASAAKTAASAAATGGTFGAGGEAGAAAAGIGIDMAAGIGKRASSYGFQMASILADSVIDQIFGAFGGPPRWIGYDYTSFLPSNVSGMIGQIGTTTAEKAMAAAQGGGHVVDIHDQAPGGPVDAAHLPGSQPVGPPVPKFGSAAAPQSLGAAISSAVKTAGGPPPGPPPPQDQGMFSDLLHTAGFDEGGWLMPNTLGLNTTGRPELVLSPQQLAGALSRNPYRGGDTYHITAVNAEQVAREIDKRKRLAAMQYSSRP